MKIALVASGNQQLGVEYISAIMKDKGHDVRLFFDPKTFGGSLFVKIDFINQYFNLKDKIIDRIIQWSPDIVGFSCMTHNFQWSLSIANEIKKQAPIPIIFGGIHPTSVPEVVLKQESIDFVAVGEAEDSFAELVSELETGKSLENINKKINGIYFKENGEIIANPPAMVGNLDALPFPDKKIFYDKVPSLSNSYHISASRGCPNSCGYCCNSYLNKVYSHEERRRVRSVDNIIEELKLAKQKYNYSVIEFIDEIFPDNISWLEEFSSKYSQEIGIPFCIAMDAGHDFKLVTSDRLQLLKQAGCTDVGVGLTSASKNVRKYMGTKQFSNEKFIEVLKMCKSYEFTFATDIIIGTPYETDEDLSYNLEFCRTISPYVEFVYTYWLTYYPKTFVTNKALRHEQISQSAYNDILEGKGEISYHRGSVVKEKERDKLLTYQILVDLSTLLSAKKHIWLEKHQSYINMLPAKTLLHWFFVFLNMTKKDTPNSQMFLLIFKNVFKKTNCP
ncbi:MAG: B12-binding domain-containing radical SAM protein [Magnetococcales bacterium]|nr:B12-binding domain-containing radical SAM protein [Magnetococcales bacterium]